MKKFLIDGRFLKEMSTGVDRFANNVLMEFDKICQGLDVTILVPPEANDIYEFKNIKIKRPKTSRCWTQGVFGLTALLTGSIPVNLCNEAAVLPRKGITCLHDVCYVEDKEHFPYVDEIPEDERKWFEKVYKRIVKKTRELVTVSEFSRDRIEATLGIPASAISVIGNGWQHLLKSSVSENYFEKHKELKKKEYFLTLSSANKNKNLEWVIKAASNNPKETFVICGKNLDKAFDLSKTPNVIYEGFVTDPDAMALMRQCKAFIFPSYYEGFGIPPMEAMSQGAQVIISDKASLPEIFGGSAHYIDPDNSDIDLDLLLRQPVEPASNVLDKYSWKISAEKLLMVFNKIAND